MSSGGGRMSISSRSATSVFRDTSGEMLATFTPRRATSMGLEKWRSTPFLTTSGKDWENFPPGIRCSCWLWATLFSLRIPAGQGHIRMAIDQVFGSSTNVLPIRYKHLQLKSDRAISPYWRKTSFVFSDELWTLSINFEKKIKWRFIQG